MANIELNLHSEVLQLEIPVTILLPQHFEQPLKTIYLYHGSTGDHTLWVRYTNVERYARERGVAVVMPTVHKSMFTNMVHGQAYGTFLGEELPERLWAMFPCLSQKREDNFVAGLSNGAYGAFRIGLRYPDRFSCIGVFSGGDAGDQYYTDDGTYRGRRHVLVYGEGCPAQTEHSVKYLAQKLVEKGGPYPRIYQCDGELECGGRPREISRFFEKLPFDYTYGVYKGVGHEWALWDQAIFYFMDEFLGLKRNVGVYYA